jgi:uncharacterized protein YbaA (DUF1428 family)
MTCYAGTLQASSEIEFFTWLNYSDRDKISAVDQLIFNYPALQSVYSENKFIV